MLTVVCVWVCGSEVEIRNRATLRRAMKVPKVCWYVPPARVFFSWKGGREGRGWSRWMETKLGTVTSPAAGAKEVRSTRSLSAFRALKLPLHLSLSSLHQHNCKHWGKESILPFPFSSPIHPTNQSITQIKSLKTHPNPIDTNNGKSIPSSNPNLRTSLLSALTPIPQDDPSTQAFFLALLTAGGGITGYVRTGSVPSIAAGCTVGALVRLTVSSPPPFLTTGN